jgi:hypothetical protein
MNDELHANLSEIIHHVSDSYTPDVLQRHLIEFEEQEEAEATETVQQIKIVLNQEGDITAATTLKIPNLKFNLGSLILESVTSVVTLTSAKEPIKIALIAIRFLQTILRLSTIRISEHDAEVLVALYILSKEEKVVSVDQLVEALKSEMVEAKISKSLENLEHLACISLVMDEIILNETIIIRRED